jgi:hypothetical protein
MRARYAPSVNLSRKVIGSETGRCAARRHPLGWAAPTPSNERRSLGRITRYSEKYTVRMTGANGKLASRIKNTPQG